jgi:hypothetical protein
MPRALATAAVLLLGAACSRGEKPPLPAIQQPAVPTPGPIERAQAAAAVADAIAAAPAKGDSILAAAGYTADGFERLMYEIAADSTMSAAYAAARTTKQ